MITGLGNAVATTDDLIDYVERHFNADWGSPRAYFTIPQRDAEPLQVVYVCYAVAADTEDAALDWMLDNVLGPLRTLAGDGAYLYWRLSTCFTMQWDGEMKKHRLYTRFAVLDRYLNVITLPAGISKPEGMAGVTL